MDPSSTPSTSYQVPAGGLPRPDFSGLRLPSNQVMGEREFERVLTVAKIQSEGKVEFVKR